eukprot:14635453-Alexandrium_andersonii.AAC.1
MAARQGVNREGARTQQGVAWGLKMGLRNESVCGCSKRSVHGLSQESVKTQQGVNKGSERTSGWIRRFCKWNSS